MDIAYSSRLKRRFYQGYIRTASETSKQVFFIYCVLFVVLSSMVIVSLTSIVLNAEEQINKDIIDLRINITVILKDIEDNCSGILVKFPNLVNVPSILSTCWRVHDYYRYAKIVVAMLIIHDSFSAYIVSGGPMSYLIISVCIGLLSILAVYVSQMGLILIIDFAYVAMGTIIIFILNNTCFTPMPPETLHLS